MGSKRAVALGMVMASLVFGCSTDRNFSDDVLVGTDGGGSESGGRSSGGRGGGTSGDTAAQVGGGGSGGGKGGVTNVAPLGGDGGMSGSPSTSTVCSADEFEDGTACKKLTVCAADEFETTPPTAKQDRVCGKATACGANEFEAAPPTASSDRVCTPLTVCAAGTWVSTPPTAKSDRACMACAGNTFSGVINATACAAWSECQSGETQSVAPSPTSDRICSKCGSGKYESGGACVALTVCSASQYESTPATATSDRKCSDVKSCQPGNRQTAAPTATTDRQCAACGSGTFSSQVNATTCKTWTVCGSNQKVSAAGTSTTDVVCVDKPVCSTAADRTCSVDCPCGSGEGVCSNNNQCTSGASCVSGSGKKVGRSGDTCLANHCNNDTKDSSETSVDCGGECGCRATFETVVLKGVPANTVWGEFETMSRDGKKLAGYLNRSRTSYPGVIASDGTVTELPAYSKSGSVASATADGSVLVGGIGCADPPNCTDTTWSPAKWSGTSSPTVPRTNATVRGASSSGNAIAGDFWDGTANHGFLLSGNSWQTINDLVYVTGVTPDGKFVAGTLPSGSTQAGLWEAQTQNLTKIGSSSWSTTTVNAINGTTPALAGYGYISSSDSYVGYRWKGGTITQLGLLSGGVYTMPASISLDGSTVVGYTGTNSFQQAFIWTDQDKLRTLVDELSRRGYEPPIDLKLTYALFVSDDGKTIVGTELTTPASFWRIVLK